MIKNQNNLSNAPSTVQRSPMNLEQEMSTIDQESTLWSSIEDEYASTIVGGQSKFNHALITKVTFPSLDSVNLEELSSGVNEASESSRIIYLNNCKPNGCLIKP